MRNQAIRAVFISIFFILLYIWIRFKFSWGVSAAAALLHDTLITIGFLSILNVEIGMTVLAALLTIVGYSINDTIVIFSKIRENMRKNSNGMSLNQIVDLSLNQTLRRTLLTSISTALTVGSIFVLGGEALHGFSFAMLVGVVFGTYSSIYVASPIMMLFSHRQK